jgi:hypothetical protein
MSRMRLSDRTVAWAERASRTCRMSVRAIKMLIVGCMMPARGAGVLAGMQQAGMQQSARRRDARRPKREQPGIRCANDLFRRDQGPVAWRSRRFAPVVASTVAPVVAPSQRLVDSPSRLANIPPDLPGHSMGFTDNPSDRPQRMRTRYLRFQIASLILRVPFATAYRDSATCDGGAPTQA